MRRFDIKIMSNVHSTSKFPYLYLNVTKEKVKEFAAAICRTVPANIAASKTGLFIINRGKTRVRIGVKFDAETQLLEFFYDPEGWALTRQGSIAISSVEQSGIDPEALKVRGKVLAQGAVAVIDCGKGHINIAKFGLKPVGYVVEGTPTHISGGSMDGRSNDRVVVPVDELISLSPATPKVESLSAVQGELFSEKSEKYELLRCVLEYLSDRITACTAEIDRSWKIKSMSGSNAHAAMIKAKSPDGRWEFALSVFNLTEKTVSLTASMNDLTNSFKMKRQINASDRTEKFFRALEQLISYDRKEKMLARRENVLMVHSSDRHH